MLHNHTPAVAGGSEAIELIRILTNQPEGPLRDQLLKTILKGMAPPDPSVDEIEAKVELMAKDKPPFLRLPKPPERCRYTGLPRTGLLELISPGERNNYQPPVKAVYKRSHPHSKRGVWHIPIRNLFRYLLLQEQGSLESFEAAREARKKTVSERI